LHVGGAVSYRTSQVNVEESPIGSVSSDGVTSMFPAALLEADIPDMGSELKGVIEFLYTAPRFMIQSEYFFDCLHRTSGQNSYRAHGGYIQGGILLKGREFEYDTMYADSIGETVPS
jgi:phosphate-selective porin OprO/OprP